MKIYGDIAVKAAESYSKYEDMEQAWTEIAASFPIKESIRKKGAQRMHFWDCVVRGWLKESTRKKSKPNIPKTENIPLQRSAF